MECECGCKQEIPESKRQGSKFFDKYHRAAFHASIRELGKKRMGELMKSAVSSDVMPVAIISNKRGEMHRGSIEGSRAQREILARLENGSATTLELHECSGSMAPATDVSALNKNLLGSGRQVVCKYKGSFGGRKVFEYSLVKA